MQKKLARQALSGTLLALSATIALGGTMGVETRSLGKTYLGVFGGGGAVTRGDISQFGTAFYAEEQGGPLAVNAFGQSDSSGTGVVGGHIGFAWPQQFNGYMPFISAIELEGYYMGGTKIEGDDISNDTFRLPEHDFLVSYPLRTGVFLVNAVLSAEDTTWGFGIFRPYVGLGIGSALISISGAKATQLRPPEPGVNHYNSNPGDTALAFAAQPKVGVHYDLSQLVSLFAEYRYVYLSQTDYTFGSTFYPGHVATSPWLASIKPQHYNLGTIGIDFDL